MKILIISLISLMLAASNEPPSKSPPKSKPLVEFQNGRMSVKAKEVPLKELLDEMEKKSGIAVELKDARAAEKQTSVDFKSLLPVRAFQEVLQDLNYAFLYSGNRLARVLILPPGVEAPAKIGGLANPTKRFEWSPRKGDAPRRTRPNARKETKFDSRVQSKLEAIEALEDSDDPKSIAALGEALTDPSPEVKAAALSALTDKQGSLATQMIRRGLNDRNPEFRIEVLEALADRGDLDSLRRASSDPNQDVRERAAELLEENKP